jgi:hypothetical protein
MAASESCMAICIIAAVRTPFSVRNPSSASAISSTRSFHAATSPAGSSSAVIACDAAALKHRKTALMAASIFIVGSSRHCCRQSSQGRNRQLLLNS